jgi:hypothetical protein
MYKARKRIKSGGKWYLPGDVVPAEVASCGSDYADFVPDPVIEVPTKTDPDQCEHIKDDGEQCKRDAAAGSEFCKQHQPKED